jgi:2-dehydropantoate 2-reductase
MGLPQSTLMVDPSGNSAIKSGLEGVNVRPHAHTLQSGESKQDFQETLIVGTGAMACLFAARLAAIGHSVWMLGSWAAGLQALRNEGVRLVHPDEQTRAFTVQVTEDPRICQGIQYALVLVKSWQTGRAAGQLAQCLAPNGLALSLQNGMGNREILAQALGSQRVALGVATSGANLVGPGRVQPAGEGVITLGIHSRLPSLADLLRTAGFVVETSADTSSLLWGKLVINAAINPLTALLGVSNGALLALPGARALLASTAREAASVAVAQGVRLPYPDPVVAAEAIARQTASNYSSMLQDLRRGAPTEIDAINGAIVLAGEQTGVPTPINRSLWQLVRATVEAGLA